MRTYYIFGRVSRNGLRFVASLSRVPPPGYTSVRIVEADSKKTALLQLAPQHFQPDAVSTLTALDLTQLSFRQELRKRM